MVTSSITRNLRQNGGRPDSTQTFRSLKMAADRYREMYGENWKGANFRSEVANTTFQKSGPTVHLASDILL